jgi:predicted flavoprotein YhiN
MSGGTRCNLTHDTDKAGIVAACSGKSGRFLHSALAAAADRFGCGSSKPKRGEKGRAGGKVFPVRSSGGRSMRSCGDSNAAVRNLF